MSQFLFLFLYSCYHNYQFLLPNSTTLKQNCILFLICYELLHYSCYHNYQLLLPNFTALEQNCILFLICYELLHYSCYHNYQLLLPNSTALQQNCILFLICNELCIIHVIIIMSFYFLTLCLCNKTALYPYL